MRQLLQALSSGRTDLVDVPVPTPSSSSLLIEGRCSAVSAGTERMIVEFGRGGWIAKVRSQPDKVAHVLSRVHSDGMAAVVEAVRSKLDAPIPLGYCHAGVVAEVGSATVPFSVGDRVVSNGAHAEYVVAPWTLSARIPDNVSFEAAAFTPIAAIGLQGIRLAAPTLGETVVVYGLGMIGLLTVQLLRANGCRVIGIDTNTARLSLAERFGAKPIAAVDDVAASVLAATGGIGADAVLLTLATPSDDPSHQAALMSRKRGRIVLVGTSGLNLRRDDFYRKELSFSVSCSYGPGRYDPDYEERAHDYPLPYVRWTEQRNLDAVLRLMAAGAVDPLPLVTHRFPFAEAERAYDLITSPEPSLGVLLEYAAPAAASYGQARTIALSPERHDVSVFSAGVIGAGNFGTRVLIPALASSGARLRVIASRAGVSAAVAARRFGFERVTTDLDEVFRDESIDTVVILTRHDTHAPLVLRALEAGKHVFVEKPLALTEPELDSIERALDRSDRILAVGFNRRFAPLAQALRRKLTAHAGPVVLILTVNAGSLPRDHWTHDPLVGGGRIIGEASHFVDLARFLIAAPIRNVSVVAAHHDGRAQEDISHLSLLFADGSTAAIHYLANGSAAFPKERIEAFADGRIYTIDNWRRMKVFGGRGSAGHRFSSMAKGHAEELAAFARSVRAGSAPPIPYDQLFDVSRWVIRAAQVARGGAFASPLA